MKVFNREIHESREGRGEFGLRRQSVAATALSDGESGVQNDVKISACESGVALRFRPQSKTPIGTKFKPAVQGGPQSKPNVGQGEYSGTVSFYFGKLP